MKGNFVVSKEDWSLHRKGHDDQKRHQEKVKEAIKKNLPDLITEESTTLMSAYKNIKDENFRYYVLKQKSDVFHAMKTFFGKKKIRCSYNTLCFESGVFLLFADIKKVPFVCRNGTNSLFVDR